MGLHRLEELDISSTYLGNELEVVSSSLRQFVFGYCRRIERIKFCCPTLESLQMGRGCYKLIPADIDCPSLVSLKVCCYLHQPFFFFFFFFLNHSSFHFSFS